MNKDSTSRCFHPYITPIKAVMVFRLPSRKPESSPSRVSGLVAVEAWLLSTNQIPALPGRPSHHRKQSWEQLGEAERQTPSVAMTAGGENNGVLCPLWLGGGNDDGETMARLQTAEIVLSVTQQTDLSEGEKLLICF
ncbi:hypothetical protein PAMA_019940 [Pampus argenteus]